MKEIGAKIKAARKNAGLTQKDLAHCIGTGHKETIRAYESGVHVPQIDRLKNIADALDVSFVSLLPDEYTKTVKPHMTVNEYQQLAARTINPKLYPEQQAHHALHGMVGEIGELHSLYQKTYQGHAVDPAHLKKELGDLLWFIAEYCTAMGWTLEDVAQGNIDKLKARYPEGFETAKSLHRKAGDI